MRIYGVSSKVTVRIEVPFKELKVKWVMEKPLLIQQYNFAQYLI